METDSITAGGDAKPTNGDATEVTRNADHTVNAEKMKDDASVKKELKKDNAVKEAKEQNVTGENQVIKENDKKEQVTDDKMDTHEATDKELAETKKTVKKDVDAKKISAEGKDEEEDSDDEESDDEEIVPLLERDPEVTGKRERKTVERFVTTTESETKRNPRHFEEGSGVRLGDCPVIENNISRGKQEDIHMLHQAIFYRPGKPHEFRKNLRNFRGFPFKKGSPEYTKRKEKMETYRLDVLRQLTRLLDLDRKTGVREELATALIDFLCDPKPSGRSVSTPSGKRRSKSTPGKGSAKKGTPGGTGKRGRPRKSVGNEADIDDAIESALRGGGSDDSDDDEPPRKKSPKKTPAKKTPKKTPAKSPKKTPAKKKKKVEEGSSDDDEPLTKKASKPPTDAEIRTLVRRLLDGANLEEVTMKTVLTKVYNKYPQHDLTARKDFIKQTVKALIS